MTIKFNLGKTTTTGRPLLPDHHKKTPGSHKVPTTTQHRVNHQLQSASRLLLGSLSHQPLQAMDWHWQLDLTMNWWTI